jgi:hypothetical protein
MENAFWVEQATALWWPAPTRLRFSAAVAAEDGLAAWLAAHSTHFPNKL